MFDGFYPNKDQEKDQEEEKYEIRIDTEQDNTYCVDDCEENWETLMNMDKNVDNFLRLRASRERENGLFCIRASEIVAFYDEKCD